MEAGPIAERLVDSINDVYGRHRGQRAAHAKGVLCHARFTPTPEAARLSRAPHFQGPSVRAHVRFSHGSGDPDAHDGRREPRGMAVKLYLDDATTSDIVGISLPFFFARTPEDFLAFSAARRPDPATGEPDLARVGAYLEAHPETMRAVQVILGTAPPASYAQLTYDALHAFRFLAPGSGAARFGRYRWLPEAGEATLEDDDAQSREADHLSTELARRLNSGAVAFALEIVLAEAEDPIEDPTARWPDDRETVRAGRIEITELAFDRERDGDVLVFDPTRVCDGIELSDDPILAVRGPAYSVSVARRGV